MTRGQPLSEDLRKTLIYMRRRCSVPEIARLTNCKQRTIERILAQHQQLCGKYPTSRRSLRGRKRALSSVDTQFIIGLIRHSPDLYLDEIQEQVASRRGVNVSVSTIYKTLKRTGYSLKTITREALERDENKRAAYRYYYGLNFRPEQTIFVDESSFDRRTAARKRAWALQGHRADSKKCFFVRGRRYSLLPALSSEGIIFARIVEGSFTADRFYDFIDGLLDRMQPFPLPNSVIIMDNARIHKDSRVLDLITQRGMRYCFLPPYSPDYNPIELAFSVIKSHVRRSGELAREDVDPEKDDTYVYQHLYHVAYSISPQDAFGFFKHCHYY